MAKETLTSTIDKDTKVQLKSKMSILQKAIPSVKQTWRRRNFFELIDWDLFANSTVVLNNQSRDGFLEELETDFLRPSIMHSAGEIKFGGLKQFCNSCAE